MRGGVLPAALGGAWATLVAVGAWHLCPPRGRLRELGRALPRRHRWRPPALDEAAGRALLRLAHRPSSPAAARRLGRAALVGATALALAPLAALPLAMAVWGWPGLRARSAARRRLEQVTDDLPDVVDLLELAVGAGLTVPLALDRVAHHLDGPLAAALRRTCAEARLGRRLADALDDLPARVGEPVRPLVAALVASERYGAPVAAGLQRLAAEVRRQRRQRAEERARRVPVKLLFPLVTCTLPAFGLLTVAPVVAAGLRSLHL